MPAGASDRRTARRSARSIRAFGYLRDGGDLYSTLGWGLMHYLFASGFHLQDLFHPLRYWGYQFWSGIGSDIGEVAIIGGLITIVRHLRCHARGCFRLAGHQVVGTPYRTCRKHHPGVPNIGATAEQIAAAAHRASLAGSAPGHSEGPGSTGTGASSGGAGQQE